jgi:hypothetical protein
MRPDELERRLRERLDALGPAPRAELLHVLTLPDFDRADRITAPTRRTTTPNLKKAIPHGERTGSFVLMDSRWHPRSARRNGRTAMNGTSR